MDVRMKTQASGPDGNYAPGQIVLDMDDDQARAWIQGGYAERYTRPPAEPAAAEAKPESEEPDVATLPEAETATKKTRRRRKS